MLTSEIVFAYVWQHFVSVFPEAKGLNVAYGGQPEDKVKVAANGMDFLAQTLPFPKQLFWHSWNGTRLPFLFELTAPELITSKEEKVVIATDIVAGAFYFLSGWQEVYSDKRDRFGRFPYTASLQHQHGFVTLPIVNYYFDILKTALEKAYGLKLQNPAWENSAFVTFLSHDIDRLESAWKVEGKRQLLKGRFDNFLKLALQKFTGQDYWFNLNTVAEKVKKHGAVSTFFWLPNAGKFQGHPNADYNIEQERYQEKINELAAAGFEIGVHGSFGSSENAEQLKAEILKTGTQISGNRFHYLCYDPVKTPQVIAKSAVAYDSSLGFAEHFGFRNAYCFPFRPFDFSDLKPYPFLEIPLNLMDATLWHPNYLKLKPEEILPAISPMLLEIKKFGGCFGLLWHNENFSELNTQNGLEVFETIMQELNKLGSSFKTGRQMAEIFRKRL